MNKLNRTKVDNIASNKSSEISIPNLNSILPNYGINLLSKILKKSLRKKLLVTNYVLPHLLWSAT